MMKVLTRRNKILLKELVRTDFKLRYQGSALGYAWSLLKPLFLFGILYLVFGQILRFGRDIPYYPVYLLAGIVIWTFFSEATKQGSNSIVSRGSLLRKISFPSYIVVLSSSFSALINFGLSLIVLFAFILISGASVQPVALVLAPLLVLELYIFALALAFMLATINVRYRDIQHIWEIALAAGFYATPIIYPLTLVIAKSLNLAIAMLAINPVAQVIQDLRYLLVTTKTDTLYTLSGSLAYYLIPFLIVTATLMYSVWLFKRRSKSFTEEV